MQVRATFLINCSYSTEAQVNDERLSQPVKTKPQDNHASLKLVALPTIKLNKKLNGSTALSQATIYDLNVDGDVDHQSACLAITYITTSLSGTFIASLIK